MKTKAGYGGDYSRKIGARIRHLRMVMDVTQGDIEKGSGLGQAALHRYERGLISIPLNAVDRIATFLKVDPMALCGPEEEFKDMVFRRLFPRGRAKK